ncbi:OmpW/AlkL family protein [Acinetobacter stercoris]|uniref:Outer membrane protein W n=1 Tax=Acinetobacter stercoris TaxID=2126983 RepID=A0A2U3MV28_9GAMM|nr:OmpW family outer membrane protein [Acinetobacter stercoris]SPL69288.1 Outer membrane protein W precursor [Acinetobacter stercoris]
MKKVARIIVPATLLAVASFSHAATSDGKTFGISAGWLHIMPQSSAQGVYGKTGSSPALQSMANVTAASPSAGFEVEDADTGGLMLDYFVNDNVSLELVLGAPPEMELSGKNNITLAGKPVVGLDKYSKAATTDAYTPTFTGRYHFGSINNKIRPYVGAGIMYAHFSDVKTDPRINGELSKTINGAVNALYPQLGGQLDVKPTLGKVKVDDAVAPVATIGVDYNITKDWFATASVSYAHLSTKAKLNVTGTIPGAGKTTILSGQSDIEINPIVTYLGIGYRF